MRVNARFEGVAEQQVEYLVASKGVSVSEVLRLSVDAFYRNARSEGSCLRNFGKHVGRHDSGQADTSTRYKEILADSLHAKVRRKQL